MRPAIKQMLKATRICNTCDWKYSLSSEKKTFTPPTSSGRRFPAMLKNPRLLKADSGKWFYEYIIQVAFFFVFFLNNWLLLVTKYLFILICLKKCLNEAKRIKMRNYLVIFHVKLNVFNWMNHEKFQQKVNCDKFRKLDFYAWVTFVNRCSMQIACQKEGICADSDSDLIPPQRHVKNAARSDWL